MVDLGHNPWRKDFPSLTQTMHGKPLVYLDSGASAQKPLVVIESIRKAYEEKYANIHRGLYEFSQVKTEEFEWARSKVARFIGASSSREIVFTRNSTEAINLVAQTWGRNFLKTGDEIILSVMEHHANLVPWFLLRDQIGVVLKFIPVLEDGTLDMDFFQKALSPRTRMVSLVHVSNVLGTINNSFEISKITKEFNPEIKVLFDGSQAVVHGFVNVQDFAPDFYVLTGHKLYGPTGVGVLYGKYDVLASMPPYQGGGDMIEKVTLEGAVYAEPPSRFEAGTPAIAEVIGLGAAVDYLMSVGMDKVRAWEENLHLYAREELMEIEGLKIYGHQPEKAAIISFTLEGCPAGDVAMILDQMGIAVRTGHHCCMPLMQHLGVDGTVRASMGMYSDRSDIDSLVFGLEKACNILR